MLCYGDNLNYLCNATNSTVLRIVTQFIKYMETKHGNEET